MPNISQVITCEECKYSEPSFIVSSKPLVCKWFRDTSCDRDDYCSHAKRKNEQQQTKYETAYEQGWNDCRKAYKETFEHIRKAAETQLSMIEEECTKQNPKRGGADVDGG